MRRAEGGSWNHAVDHVRAVGDRSSGGAEHRRKLAIRIPGASSVLRRPKRGIDLPEEAQAWITGCVSDSRTANTVKTTWISATRTVFACAFDTKLVPVNPFASVKIKVPKQKRFREKTFKPEEVRLILREASDIESGEASTTPGNVGCLGYVRTRALVLAKLHSFGVATLLRSTAFLP
jgi:hypothetical protein